MISRSGFALKPREVRDKAAFIFSSGLVHMILSTPGPEEESQT